MFKFSLSYVLLGSLASVLQAESLEKTFTVAVSNAVTHHIEMAPSTFRYGAQNGGVERLEGNCFVAVPFMDNPSFQSPWMPAPKMWLAISNRLQRIQLPPIKTESTTMSMAIGMIEKILQESDGSTNAPLKLSYYQDKRGSEEDEYIVPLDLPATNAFALTQLLRRHQELGKCSRDCKKESILRFKRVKDSQDSSTDYLPDCCKKQGKPLIRSRLNLKDGEDIVSLFGDFDTCSFTRVYTVPNRFFKCYPTEEHLKAATNEKLGRIMQFDFSFGRLSNLVRVDHGGPLMPGRTFSEQLNYFEEQMLLPFYKSSATWTKTCVSVGDGDERILFAYASDDGSFGGIWRYCAVKGEDGVLRERFIPCPMPLGFVDKDTLQFYTHREGVDATGQIKKECFAYTTHQGAVFRFDGQQFIPITSECDPSSGHALHAPPEETPSWFKSIVIPEFNIQKGTSIHHAIAYLENLLSSHGAPTNQHVRIVLIKGEKKKLGFSSVERSNPAGMFTNARAGLPALANRSISLHDALLLVSDICGLYPVFNKETATIELMDFDTYFRKTSYEKEYLFHMSVGVKMPTLQDWERLFYDEHKIPREYLRITLCSPLTTGIIKIRLLPGHYGEQADNIIQTACTKYHLKRFTLEHSQYEGETLMLIDNDTGAERIYRASYDPTGKRNERFEIRERRLTAD
jgi:hypothetical protein